MFLLKAEKLDLRGAEVMNNLKKELSFLPARLH
jgi:hypothetical protein